MREKQSFYLGGWVSREDLGGAEGGVEGGVERGVRNTNQNILHLKKSAFNKNG